MKKEPIRVCSKCREHKPATDFYNNERSRQCKACIREAMKKLQREMKTRKCVRCGVEKKEAVFRYDYETGKKRDECASCQPRKSQSGWPKVSKVIPHMDFKNSVYSKNAIQ